MKLLRRTPLSLFVFASLIPHIVCECEEEPATSRSVECDIHFICQKSTGNNETECNQRVLGILNDDSMFFKIMKIYGDPFQYYSTLQVYPEMYIYSRTASYTSAMNLFDDVLMKFCTFPQLDLPGCKQFKAYCANFPTRLICQDEHYKTFDSYMDCSLDPMLLTSDCMQLCDRAVISDLFKAQDLEKHKCAIVKTRCATVNDSALVSHCEGRLPRNCNIRARNTYPICESAIRNMSLPDKELEGALTNSSCRGDHFRLVCFQYLRILEERKMATNFIDGKCDNGKRPEVCNVMEDFCFHRYLNVSADSTVCKRFKPTETMVNGVATKDVHNLAFALLFFNFLFLLCEVDKTK